MNGHRQRAAGSTPSASESPVPAAPRSQPSVSRPEEDEARSSSKYRAALEAMFAPKATSNVAPEPVAPRAAKMVTVPVREAPRREERDKRLAKLLGAEGRAAVTKACEALLRAGFELPNEQEVWLKLLDHDADERVRAALVSLARLLTAEAPQRRAVLDGRLRRLEESADDGEVRALAASLRAQLRETH